MATDAVPAIVVARQFAAPPARIWAAWNDPEQVSDWWGPHGFSATVHGMDLRVGGEWRFTLHGPDGADYENRVVYTTVEPPLRLAYDHFGHGDTATPHLRGLVTFAEHGGGTAATLSLWFPSTELRERAVESGVVQAGEQTLERLAALVDG